MRLNDLLKEYTFSIKREIESLDSDIYKLQQDVNIIEQTRNQSTTEIKHINRNEKELKAILQELSRYIDETQRKLDELEKQRQEQIEKLLSLREEQAAREKEIKQIRDNLIRTYEQVKEIELKKLKAEDELKIKNEERARKVDLCKSKYLEAFKYYIQEEENYIHVAFKSLEEINRLKKISNDFHQRRQEDPLIADLYEQREELLRLIKESNLDTIRTYLQDKLKAIETRIEEIFPGVLSGIKESLRYNDIIEIIFTMDNEQKGIFWLPITIDTWEKFERGEQSAEINNVACFLWSMIKQLNLTRENGEFILKENFICFRSVFEREDISILNGFNIECDKVEILKCIFTKAPTEIEEVLLNEN